MSKKLLFLSGYIQILTLILVILITPIYFGYGGESPTSAQILHSDNPFIQTLFHSIFYISLILSFVFIIILISIVFNNLKLIFSPKKLFNKFIINKKLLNKFVILGYINLLIMGLLVFEKAITKQPLSIVAAVIDNLEELSSILSFGFFTSYLVIREKDQ